MTDPAPLIVTLDMDEPALDYFNALRRRHFPAERNLLRAHLTLFHKLPGEEIASISRQLAEGAATLPSFELTVSGLRNLGRGMAFSIQSEELLALRARLADRWRDWFTPQDRQKFSPHVTVQNKVDPESALMLYQGLMENFHPFKTRATAILLWHYRGGPWDNAGRFAFSGGGEASWQAQAGTPALSKGMQ